MNALVCRSTGERFAPDRAMWRSPAGGLLDLEFEARFPLERIAARAPTMWRYREALPIERNENVVTLGEGFTPLVPAEVFGRRVLLKLDHLFPSGSFKDRGASVLVSKVRELGVRRVVEDSSGNAGAAIAAYCARAGIECDIYVPAANSPAKLAQIRLCGARVHAIPGARADTAAAAWEAAQSEYYASHVWNPYFVHGTKTFAFEVCEQLGWQPPDAVVVPTGNGTLLCGACLGFRELRAAGVIDRLPKLVGVQAANCAPLCDAWRRRASASSSPLSGVSSSGDTIAEGIAITSPARAEQCLEAVRETRSTFATVTEDEIVAGLREMLRQGIYLEPTSATAIAALQHVECEGTIVVPITGHGLKAGDKLATLPA